MSISVVLNAHNEAELLQGCLESVAEVATEIVVVDGGSSDATAQVASAYGARVIHETNKLMLNINKNVAIDAATGDWILLLDPDERLTPQLADELIAISCDHGSEAAAWWIPRRNYTLGKWIRNIGQYPDPQLRFFRRGAARFPCEHIHEMVTVTGSTARTKHDMEHRPPQDIWTYVHKRNLYSEHRAAFLYEQGIRFQWHRLLGRPAWAFIKSYFFRGGWREGVAGFIICVSAGYGTMLQDAKLWEQWQGVAETAQHAGELKARESQPSAVG